MFNVVVRNKIFKQKFIKLSSGLRISKFVQRTKNYL